MFGRRKKLTPYRPPMPNGIWTPGDWAHYRRLVNVENWTEKKAAKYVNKCREDFL